MALGVDGVPAGRVVWKTALLTLGTVGFVVCLTMMYLSMRAVMDVGGTCASGGPFEIRQECPEGVAWIMPVSIFGGLASLAIGAIGVFKQGGPRPYVFAWSALFLALGWNFLEYGFDSPGGGSEWGWIVCGVVFVLMGGVPLLGLLSPAAFRWTLWGPPSSSSGSGSGPSSSGGGSTTEPERPTWRHLVPTARAAPTRVVTITTPDASSTVTHEGSDLVTRLERLADLHDRGAIDDAEYETAKDAILKDEAGG